jgi:hypothetical protein
VDLHWLVKHGADLDAKDSQCHTPLAHAVRVAVWDRCPSSDRFTKIGRLLEAGADINVSL